MADQFSPADFPSEYPQLDGIVAGLEDCWCCVGEIGGSIESQLTDQLRYPLTTAKEMQDRLLQSIQLQITQPLATTSELRTIIRDMVGTVAEPATETAATVVEFTAGSIPNPTAQPVVVTPTQTIITPTPLEVAQFGTSVPPPTVYIRPNVKSGETTRAGSQPGASLCDLIGQVGLARSVEQPPFKFDDAMFRDGILGGPDDWIKAVLGAIPGLAPGLNIGSIASGSIIKIFEGIVGSVDDYMKSVGCFGPQTGIAFALRAAMNAFGMIIGDAGEPINALARYTMNANCPFLYPGSEDSIASYLANAIDYDTYESWVKLNGNCPDPYKAVLEARRSKFKPDELIKLWNRGTIGDSAFNTGLRQLGYLEPEQRQGFAELAKYIPPPSDIIRFMVRDVEDNRLVDKFGMDADFGDKFRGESERYAKSWGIDSETMKRYWRSHWTIPGPSQLYEMVQRLERLPAGDPSRIAMDDVREALRQQDILPFWIDPLIAISYTPVSRVDIRRLVDTGVYNRPAAVEAYRQIGYDAKNAELLADFAYVLKNRGVDSSDPIRLWKSGTINRAEAKLRLEADNYEPEVIERALLDAGKQQSGFIAFKLYGRQDISRDDATIKAQQHGLPDAFITETLDTIELGFKSHPVIAKYESGKIDRNGAFNALAAGEVGGRIARKLLLEAEQRLDEQFNKPCIAGVGDRFINGEITSDKALAELIGFGFVPEFAQRQVDAWQCQLAARGKMPSVSILSQWLESGLINGVEFLDRLKNLGWQDDDAMNIASQLIAKMNLKQRKELEGQINQEAKELEKQRKEQSRIAKAILAGRAKANKAREAAAKAKQRREKQIVNAGAKLQKTIALDLSESIEAVRAAKRLIQDEYSLPVDEAIQLATLAAEKSGAETILAYTKAVIELAVEFQTSDPQEIPLRLDDSFSVNGSTDPSA